MDCVVFGLTMRMERDLVMDMMCNQLCYSSAMKRTFILEEDIACVLERGRRVVLMIRYLVFTVSRAGPE